MILSNLPNSLRELSLLLRELRSVEAKRRYLDPLKYFKELYWQTRILADKAKTLFVGGGNRSSKTTVIAIKVIRACLERKSRWWACAETFPDSVNIQQRKIWELLPKREIRYGHYDDINGFRNRKLTFKNGSIISFKSYDQKREAFQGDDCDGIWNDEEPPYDIYKEQRMRLLDRDGTMIISMTSLKGVTELISEIYEEAENLETQYADLVQEELPRVMKSGETMIYTLWTTENPHIAQERVAEEIKLLSRDEIKSRIYGIPTALSGKMYPQFNKTVHVIRFNDVPRRKVCLYNILDPHDAKPWAMQWWVVNATNAYCVYEYPFDRNFNDMGYDDKTFDEYAEVIKQTETYLISIFGRSVSRRIIDPNYGNKTIKLSERADATSRTTVVKELAKRGLRFRDGIDNLETGHMQVRKWLYWAKKDEEIIARPKMFIVDHCINTIRHLSKYAHKELIGPDGDAKKNPQLTQSYKDYCDLVRYFVMDDPRYIPRQVKEDDYFEKKY